MMEEMAAPQLLELWQRRLRLQDWFVDLRVSRNHEMPSGNQDGATHFCLRTKEAVIHVLHPSDRDPRSVCRYDFEQVLVHELLHLHFAGATPDNDTPEMVALEQAIDLTAWALVQAYRDVPDPQA